MRVEDLNPGDIFEFNDVHFKALSLKQISLAVTCDSIGKCKKKDIKNKIYEFAHKFPINIKMAILGLNQMVTHIEYAKDIRFPLWIYLNDSDDLIMSCHFEDARITINRSEENSDEEAELYPLLFLHGSTDVKRLSPNKPTIDMSEIATEDLLNEINRRINK